MNNEPFILDEDLKEMERFFEIALLPDGPIKLDKCSQIIEPKIFVKTHLSIVKAQRGNPRYKPYMDRLLRFKQLITS